MNRVWTAKVFVSSDVGEIDARVVAGTPQGAEKQIRTIYGEVQQIYNLREVGMTNNRVGHMAREGGTGCLLLLGALLISAVGIFGGDDFHEAEPMNTPAPYEAPSPAAPYNPTPWDIPSHSAPTKALPEPPVTPVWELEEDLTGNPDYTFND